MSYQTSLAELMLAGNTTWPEYMQAHFFPKDPSASVEAIVSKLTAERNQIASSGYAYQEQVKALARIIRALLLPKM